MNFGVASRNLGDIPRALNALLSARNYSERSGNNIQVAIAENNLSQLYKSERRFEKAHAAIDHATELFRQIKDRTREGFALDTKALIYFDEGKYDAALATVERALAILGKSENYGYLTETIATKAKIQLYSDDFSTATLTLLEAVEIAKVNISEAAAVNLVSEFEQVLKQRNSPQNKRQDPEQTGLASGNLKLSLPAAISHYNGYQGVWINNSDLEGYGLASGSLAVVVPCEVRRGDLVAVIELENDLVSCGFYDSDFGIVCLEVGGSEPQLFSEADIKVLGKIVGVCNVEPGRDEALEVQPLTL
jgi:tetratricopeptide (TPR) repeat protein